MKFIRYLLLCLLVSGKAAASDNIKNWDTFTDIGAYGLVGLALAKPIYMRDWQGMEQAGLSIVTASAIGLVGKTVVDKPRPDRSDNDSFPSNHTANAFSAATTLYIRYGWEVGFPALGLATMVGVGRVEAKKHYWEDVLVGAAIGAFSAWVFTDNINSSVQILPWATSDEIGMSLSYAW